MVFLVAPPQYTVIAIWGAWHAICHAPNSFLRSTRPSVAQPLSSMTLLPLAHYDQAALTSFLFFEHNILIPASGPLHLPFFLISLDMYMVPSLTSFRSWLQYHLLREVFFGLHLIFQHSFPFPSSVCFPSPNSALFFLQTFWQPWDYISLLYHWYPSIRRKAYKVRNRCFVQFLYLQDPEIYIQHLVGAQ